MEKFYENDLVTLFNGDCVKVLGELAEEGYLFDAVITDPPYNISRDNNFSQMNSVRVGMDFGEWDKDFDITAFIYKLPKILKENANVVIFNAWENLKDIKVACEKCNIYIKRCLVLNKSNPAPFNKDRMFVNDVEFALWGVYNSKGKPTGWTFNRQNALEKCVIDTQVQSSELHPTMKDEKVIEHLIEVLTNKNDLVLDCFMGSGTTGRVCKKYGRKFVGIEIDEKYFKIAKERIEFGNDFVFENKCNILKGVQLRMDLD